ncbi:snakin-1 [Setaria italica]|nr:snakin-1 [Setaria italica]
MKGIPMALLLLTLVAVASFQDIAAVAAGSAPVPNEVCDAKCRSPCSLKKAGRCMGLCMMRCTDCQGCVPSGPYASKDECPCYKDKKSPNRLPWDTIWSPHGREHHRHNRDSTGNTGTRMASDRPLSRCRSRGWSPGGVFF